MGSLDQFSGYVMSKDRELAVIEQGQVTQILDIDWVRMVDSIGEPIQLPTLSREVMEKMINRIELPGFPDEQKEEIIQILAQRGEWIEDRVRQINKFYPL